MEELNEKQQIIIQSYLDGECGFLDRKKAEKLLENNPAAKEFYNSMKLVSEKAHAAFEDDVKNSSVDLWDKISMRIAQEEHAAVFLGERKPVKEEKPGWLMGLAWGTPGAALAALAFFMISSNSIVATNSSTPSMMGAAGTNVSASASTGQAPSVNFVSSGGVQGQGIQRQMPLQRAQSFNGLNNPVEVDWMRSDGSVRLLEDPSSHQGAIFWVRRRGSSIAGTRNSNNIQIIDDQVPDAIAVGSK